MQAAQLEMPRAKARLMHPMLPQSAISVGLGYLVGYILLDWVSYIRPFAGIGITPWNPQTGLSFALLLLYGLRYLPGLFIAQLAADILVRGLPVSPGAELAVIAITVAGYGLAIAVLLGPNSEFDPTLSSRAAVIRLMVAALISIALVSAGHALVLLAFGLIPVADLLPAALQAFVGDLIGVMVFTPFLLTTLTSRQLPRLTLEAVILVLIMLLSLWAVLSLKQPFRFQLFYVLFLPITWIAVRFGLAGAAAGLVVMQIGLIGAIELTGQSSDDVLAYQILMAVLAVTGLAIGVVVTEQQRIQNRLRLHQEALSRASRVATMGEFAAAVAHEINQPLTAIGNFARLAKLAAERNPPDVDAVAKASTEATAQVDRAAAVVSRLREFIRVGQVEKQPLDLSMLVDDALLVLGPQIDRWRIACANEVDRNLPKVLADRTHIEQVILNLLRNAAEALASAGRYDGRIVIRAEQLSEEMVEVSVTDNGPGLDPDVASQPIDAFVTTKPDGLGLGLSLSRSVIEAHGGQLRIKSLTSGVRASFTLQTEADAGTP
jgi:two-component system, LuxR family, sensor kinase FixL